MVSRGEFAGALKHFRRAQELGFPSAALVKQAQQLLAMDERFSLVLADKAPAAAAELAALAHMAQQFRYGGRS